MLPTGNVLGAALVLLTLGSIASPGSACPYGPEKLPGPEIYVSGNGLFAVAIVPRPLESRPGGDLQAAPGEPGTEALVYAVDQYGEPQLAGRFALVHEAEPLGALVSDDGQFLITFGDWKRSVVIYRTDGSLVRSLALGDILTASDIKAVTERMGGWREGQHIDESGTVLVLRIGSGFLEESPEVAFHLDHGTPLRPARDLLPREVRAVRLGPGEAPGGRDRPFHPEDPRCPDVAAFESAPEVPFERLRAAAAELALPATSEVARKARLHGSVVLELLVENGAVACVRTVKDLPIGLGRAARQAALTWRFPPSGEGEAPFRTSVEFDFISEMYWPAPEP
jgi:Gram-negative bacterial TonB protein C-terminal